MIPIELKQCSLAIDLGHGILEKIKVPDKVQLIDSHLLPILLDSPSDNVLGECPIEDLSSSGLDVDVVDPKYIVDIVDDRLLVDHIPEIQ